MMWYIWVVLNYVVLHIIIFYQKKMTHNLKI